jgi:hypothetical protein
LLQEERVLNNVAAFSVASANDNKQKAEVQRKRLAELREKREAKKKS